MAGALLARRAPSAPPARADALVGLLKAAKLEQPGLAGAEQQRQ